MKLFMLYFYFYFYFLTINYNITTILILTQKKYNRQLVQYFSTTAFLFFLIETIVQFLFIFFKLYISTIEQCNFYLLKQYFIFNCFFYFLFLHQYNSVVFSFLNCIPIIIIIIIIIIIRLVRYKFIILNTLTCTRAHTHTYRSNLKMVHQYQPILKYFISLTKLKQLLVSHPKKKQLLGQY